jgi:hypothetical protein
MQAMCNEDSPSTMSIFGGGSENVNNTVFVFVNELVLFPLTTASALKTLDNNQDSDLKCDHTDTLYVTRKTSAYDLTNKRESTSTSASTSCSSPDIRSSKKM